MLGHVPGRTLHALDQSEQRWPAVSPRARARTYVHEDWRASTGVVFRLHVYGLP